VDWLSWFDQFWDQRLDALKAAIEEIEDPNLTPKETEDD
jgi:hypothetical protein